MSNTGGSARKILSQSSRQKSLARGSPQVQEPHHSRGKTKRITVDLPIPEHKFLRDFAYDNETDGMKVMRALLLELHDDPELQRRLLSRLPSV
jgi:hypothetical protein